MPKPLTAYHTQSEIHFDEFFHNAPQTVNVETIRNQWMSLAPPYDVDHWMLPLPVWKHRQYDHSPSQAWEFLRYDLTTVDPNKPFCVYIHSPFCSSKCGFCDSYSFKLGSHRTRRIQEYVERLCYEMRLWSEQGNLSKRPVSTVHLGGGTPTFLGEAALTQIVECCQAHFTVSSETEWALESTVESLTPGMITTMHELGFRRLHIGVQSLQNPVRAAIGRRCPPSKVLEIIQSTRDLGWVVSVDMLCGLPHQTLEGLVTDIQNLIGAGVNGVSLYELLIYPQNRRWAEKYGLINRCHLPNYFAFQAGASVLEAYGYTKNLFNHWADAMDKNIYFTFPTRGEDCLALGAIADGVFGDYHYRHPGYMPYLRTLQSGQPGLEGGLRRNGFESLMFPINTLMLTGHIPPNVHNPLASSCSMLLEHWQEMMLIEAGPQGGLNLTGNGSWFVGNMIEELTTYFRKHYQ